MKLINLFPKRIIKAKKRNLRVLKEEVKVVVNKDLRRNRKKKNDTKLLIYLKLYSIFYEVESENNLDI